MQVTRRFAFMGVVVSAESRIICFLKRNTVIFRHAATKINQLG
jgi:hypothetical protein